MAKVAAAGPVHPSNALKFGGGGGSKVTATTVKRKTPSELRESFPAEQSGSIKKSSVPSAFPAENQQQLKCPESFLPSTVSGKYCATKTCSTSQRCNENTFRSVTELSLGGVDAHGLSTIDMDKAVRGLATHEHQVAFAKIAESSELDGGSRSKIFSLELHVPCKMTPLDLTMKTNIRVVSASSIN
ncbi:PREDICTED: uncharacterized protein LOC109235288 isoform X2 [Nicotiana attenuata]|nr:PREDICTED: uncharacterized protein LOC109235288 isoform X2 [Nicotiana attenuata]